MPHTTRGSFGPSGSGRTKAWAWQSREWLGELGKRSSGNVPTQPARPPAESLRESDHNTYIASEKRMDGAWFGEAAQTIKHPKSNLKSKTGQHRGTWRKIGEDVRNGQCENGRGTMDKEWGERKNRTTRSESEKLEEFGAKCGD